MGVRDIDCSASLVTDLQFLFWQEEASSQSGTWYITTYRVAPGEIPHIGIVDPRTGELLRRWNGSVAPEELIEHRM